jgi:hypothetical protein
MYLGKHQRAGFDCPFARLDDDCGVDLANAIRRIDHTCLPTFLAHPDDLIAPVIRVLPNLDTDVVVPLMMALLDLVEGRLFPLTL